MNSSRGGKCVELPAELERKAENAYGSIDSGSECVAALRAATGGQQCPLTVIGSASSSVC
jgi:hypothetical protein